VVFEGRNGRNASSFTFAFFIISFINEVYGEEGFGTGSDQIWKKECSSAVRPLPVLSRTMFAQRETARQEVVIMRMAAGL
jgi:hypothetical protein